MSVDTRLRCTWCQLEPEFVKRCERCGLTSGACAFHFGYHVAYAVLGPACPGCGVRDVARSVEVDTPHELTTPPDGDALPFLTGP